MKHYRAIAIVAFLFAACANHAPSSLSGPGLVAYQANRVVVAIGTAQHAAIELNKVQVCDPAPCHPLLSDKDTGIVVDAAVDAAKVLSATPGGWKSTANVFISTAEARLSGAGKGQIAAYLEMVRTIVNSIK